MNFISFAVTAPGLEKLCADELAQQGIKAKPIPGGALFKGGWSQLMKAHLHSRLASRILLRFGEFIAVGWPEMERKILAQPWKDYFIRGKKVAFQVTSKASELYHTDAVRERLERWLGPLLGCEFAAGGAEEDREDLQTFHVRIDHNQVTLSADATGRPLYKRGYREFIGKAPMRETLAPAFVKALGWTGGEPLADLFCGSGTIPIEAALMQRNIPPALARADRQSRPFAFEAWKTCPPGVWKALVDQARQQILPPGTGVKIFASDRDAGAVAGARENARRAGVEEDIFFTETAFSGAVLPPEPGVILSNPPYGKRIGESSDLRDLYAGLGNYLRRQKNGWRMALFCPEKLYLDATGLEVEEVLDTRNGGLRVGLYSCRVKP